MGALPISRIAQSPYNGLPITAEVKLIFNQGDRVTKQAGSCHSSADD